MQSTKRWIELEADETIVNQLQSELNIHPILCKLLVLRGIKTFNDAKDFFRPSLEKLHDPFLMKDMDKAIERIEMAIAQNQNILIYGDYDVDGTTAVSLVYSYFNEFYKNISYYIPDRYTEGYGISFQAIDFAKDNDISLIIALDCGIKANDKVDYANKCAIDFIICDHHLPGDSLPNAIAILDPKRDDCNYPYDELSGCGIGFKLIQAYAQKHKLNLDLIYDQLDLVAISIASDIVPITGENRILAKFGTDRINTNPRAGIKALMSELKLSRNLDVTDLVFIIGPRINAAGRIAHGSEAVTLLIENDYEIALEKTKKIQQNNTDRKTIDKDITDEAFEMIESNLSLKSKKSTVLYQEHWHKGVVGIVASRLIEKHYKPTIVLASSNGKAVGSGRSVPGFDLYAAIDACSEHLVQFGGHKYAAGLTIEVDKIQDFSDAFDKYVSENITPEQLIPQIEIDAEIELSDINEKFYSILEQMAPFGPQNMKPTFVTKDVYDSGYTKELNGNHLKLHIMKKNQPQKNGIGFGMGNLIKLIEEQESYDICYQLYANVWNNQTKIEFKLIDIK